MECVLRKIMECSRSVRSRMEKKEEDWLICRQSTLMRHRNKFERSDIFHRRQQKEQKLKQIRKGNLLLKRCQLPDKVARARTFTAVDRNCLASDQKVCAWQMQALGFSDVFYSLLTF